MSTEAEVVFVPASEQTPDGVAPGNKSFVEVEAVEEPKAAPVVQQPVVAPPAEQPKAAVPEGWEQVDFTKIADPTLRAQVEARFNRLYGQVKAGERQWETVRQYQESLEKKLENLQKGQETQLQNDTDREISDLKAKFVEAYNAGNTDQVVEYLKQINEKDLAQKMKAMEKPAEKQPEEQQQVFNIPEPAKVEIQKWGADKPWAQKNHPLFAHTVQVMNHFLQEGAKSNQNLPWLFSQTEAYMNGVMNNLRGNPAPAPVTPTPAANEPKIVGQVLGQQQGVTNTPQQAANALSEEEMVVARKMYNKLKPADAYKKYQRGKNM